MIPTYVVKPNVGADYAAFSYPVGMEELGRRLRDARKGKRLTQQQVADHFQIARVSVTQWESGKTRPDPDKFLGISQLYGVDIDWLLNGSGSGPDGVTPTADDLREAADLTAAIMDLSPADRAYIRGRIDERKERASPKR